MLSSITGRPSRFFIVFTPSMFILCGLFQTGRFVLKQSYIVYKKAVPAFATRRYFTNEVSIVQQEGNN